MAKHLHEAAELPRPGDVLQLLRSSFCGALKHNSAHILLAIEGDGRGGAEFELHRRGLGCLIVFESVCLIVFESVCLIVFESVCLIVFESLCLIV